MIVWQPYLIAIVIGLLIGIERERSQASQKTMGVRTFVLISLLGAISGGLENLWLSLLIAAFALALVVISYFTQTYASDETVDRGLTTEFAAGIVFCLGFAAHQSPALSAVLGPVVAVILFSKNTLHGFTQRIKSTELEAALLILLTGVVIVGFVPDRVVDPWGVLNPKKFGYLILTLAVLEFLSYVAAKVIGEKKGSLLIGFLGGFVSSTAVLVSSARQAKKTPENWRNSLAAALAAKLASLIELFIIVALVAPTLVLKIAVPTGASLILGAGALFLFGRRMFAQHPELQLRSPLDWTGVLRLAFTLGAILALISLTQLWLGDRAALTMSFLTGLFELHGVSLASATMFKQDQMTLEAASLSIRLAIVASLVAKIIMAWIIAQGPFAKALTGVFITMIAAVMLASL